MASQEQESDKRFSSTADYAKLNEYDYSMKTAPALSQLRYAMVPGTLKKFNNMFLLKSINEVQKTQQNFQYIPSYVTQAPLAKIIDDDFEYAKYR